MRKALLAGITVSLKPAFYGYGSHDYTAVINAQLQSSYINKFFSSRAIKFLKTDKLILVTFL